ncbi:MAG TPA: hypothetical protein VHM91_16185, partial [Verrucomicrobiales bacterium]|nr:hypothetical protein [Verrucomicrobiales bacterium]
MKNPLLKSLTGTWIVERLSAEGTGILVITPEGRWVEFDTSGPVPSRRFTGRLWASDEGED